MDRQHIHELAELLSDSPRIKDNHRSVMIRCPFAAYDDLHSSSVDHKPSFSIHPVEGGRSGCLCFTCHRHGTLGRVIRELNTLSDGSFSEALAFVDEHDTVDLGIQLENAKGAFSGAPREPSPDQEEYQKRRKFLAQTTAQRNPYWASRGVTPTTEKLWSLGYDSDLQRAVIPVISVAGNVEGIIGRTVNKHHLRYLVYQAYSPRIKDFLIGEHLVDPTLGVLHICEGPIDAVVASQYLPNVVAVMGSILSEKQRSTVKRLASKVVILGDGDGAGRDFALSAGKSLRRAVPVRIAELPDGEDPASLRPELLRQVVEDAALLLK